MKEASVDRVAVTIAAIGLLITTGGPSTAIALHVLDRPQGPESPVFMFPFAAVAIVGVLALGRELNRCPIRSWPFPIWFVAAYVAWAAASATWSVAPGATTRAQ